MSIQPRTSVVTIYQGDYLDRIRHLEMRYGAALEAEKGQPRTLSDVPESQALIEEHKALVEEAEASAMHVSVFALGRKAWRTLVAEHPPREGHKDDLAVGVNEETFKDALVPLSIVYPEGHELAGTQQLSEDDQDRLSEIDWDRLYFAAFSLNRSAAFSPKALVSPPTPQKDETSN